MVSDARSHTKTWIETYWTEGNTRNDADLRLVTQVMYENPNYPLTLELKEPTFIDIIITVGKPDSSSLVSYNHVAYGYEEHVPIKIWSVDRVNVTGTKAVWQAEAELRRICEENPLGSIRGLERVGDLDLNLGSTILHGSEYTLVYRRGIT